MRKKSTIVYCEGIYDEQSQIYLQNENLSESNEKVILSKILWFIMK